MSLNLGKNRRVKIVDRTLPEMFSNRSSVRRLEIIYFCWLLKDMGVDFFEVDSNILDLIGKLPSGLDFSYRIKNEKDVDRCIKNKINEVVVPLDFLKRYNLLNNLKSRNVNIVLEYQIERLKEFDALKYLKDFDSFGFIKEIRITGLNTVSSFLWVDKVLEIEQLLNVSINVCPKNRYAGATALCLEAIMNNISSITVSFLGYGKEWGFAALEEVLMAVKILVKPDMKMDFSNLPEMTRFFSRITGNDIPESKAVAGKGIFKYQSGIHADGIEKNPLTYEPFDPSIVGQIRKLTIGKHSGRRAVQKKLKELGIKCKIEEAANILEHIREKSSECKRDLFDYEVIDIYKSRYLSDLQIEATVM
ncbi:MAG: homocitrate synthase/isopropylmalate synthase family protein [Bacillota bacterium]